MAEERPTGTATRAAKKKAVRSELEGRAEVAAHDGERRLAEVERAAEITPDDVLEKDRVLHGERPVEAQVLPDAHDLARGRIGREEQRHGVARQAHHHEDHGGDEPERDQRSQEPLAEKREETSHGEAPPPLPLPRGGKRQDGTALRAAELEVEAPDLELLIRSWA